MSILSQFLPQDPSILKNLEMLRPVIEKQTVSSKDDAYLVFSKALSMTNQIENEKTKEIWMRVLENSRFEIEGLGKKYDFHAICSLARAGKKAFDVSCRRIDPSDKRVEELAATINSIAEESVGSGFGDDLHYLLKSPIGFGVVAEAENTTPVAAIFGTYVEALELFHINFLGRKVDYPGIHVMSHFQEHLQHLLSRFPKAKLLTLCVLQENRRMQAVYEKLGFRKLDSGMGRHNSPIYFYGMKLDEAVSLPNLQEFGHFYQAARKSCLPRSCQ